MISLKSWFERWEAFSDVVSEIESFKNHSFSCVGVTTSTNDDLKIDWVKFPPPPKVHVSAHQTAGRGSFGRKWIDKPDNSLLASFSWFAKNEDIDGLPLQMLAGIAVHKALEMNWSGSPKPWLKWPNDIWIGDTKVGGILVEGTAMENCHAFVIGIGINLNGKPEENFENPAGSLTEFGFQAKVWDLLENILRQWDLLMKDNLRKVWVKEYMARSKEFFEKSVLVQLDESDETLSGRPLEISEDGSLLVQLIPEGRCRLTDGRKIRIKK